MIRRGVVVVLVSALTTGCAAQLTTGGGARFEHLAPTVGSAQQGVRADARGTLTVPVGRGSLAVSGAPSALLPINDATSLRAQLRSNVVWTLPERARVRPVLRLGYERGTTGASDVANAVGEGTIDPRPDRATLTSARHTGEVAVDWQHTRRHAVRAVLVAERSGGVGSDASVLPSLQRDALGLHSDWRADARSTLSVSASAERAAVGESAPWESVQATTQWSRRSASGVTVGFAAGGVVAAGAVASRANVRVQRAAAPSRVGFDVMVEQGPELDRLDGTVRMRQRVRGAFETPRVSPVSFRGGVQAFMDRDGTTPRRGVGVDVVVQQRLGGSSVLEIGMARLVLWEGTGAARGENRLSVGLRILEPAARCRNSC
jgi:hypothetical protein